MSQTKCLFNDKWFPEREKRERERKREREKKRKEGRRRERKKEWWCLTCFCLVMIAYYDLVAKDDCELIVMRR